MSRMLLVLGMAVLMLMVPWCTAEKIVWIPYPGGLSHQMIAVKTLRELASRGHTVVVVNADFPNRDLYTRVDHTNVTYHPYDHPWSPEQYAEFWKKVAKFDPFTGGTEFAKMDASGCDSLLSNGAVVEKIRDADVVIVDAASRCGSVVRDYLKIPIRVDFLPVTFADPFFLPRLGSVSPVHTIPQLGSRLARVSNIGDRVHNTIVWFVDKLIETFVADRLSAELRAKYNLSGTHAEAMADTGMMIVQTSWGIEFPTAVPPSVKLVGPILAAPAKPLPADIDEFVRAGRSKGWGTLIVSFGSQAILTQEQVDTLAEAFGKLDANVLWKPPHVQPTKVSNNVKVMNWFPQNDLLGHPDVVAFLAHGGLNGVSEAAYHGVPVIGFPLFADQWDNIARLQHHGMATVVDSETFTADSLAAEITRVVTDESFARSAARVSAIVRDTPKPAVVLAADWIDYAIRHDGALFQKVLWPVNIPWYVAGGYDVFFILVVLPLIVMRMLCLRCCCRGGRAKTKAD
mmetsp:Transcript_20925/g.54400  ORF Transcript_20925/g.54400 Transcript_20925/m.54400 type:complete len:514 (-) Transcript_20925:50-1591(-)